MWIAVRADGVSHFLPVGLYFLRIVLGETMAKRTTMRSSKGTKLYAVRDKSGKFEDIQTYKRAHAADLRRKSKAELAKKSAKTAKKAKARKAKAKKAKSRRK